MEGPILLHQPNENFIQCLLVNQKVSEKVIQELMKQSSHYNVLQWLQVHYQPRYKLFFVHIVT